MSNALPKSKTIVLTLSQLLMQRLRSFRDAGVAPELDDDYDFLAFALYHYKEGRAQLAQDLWVLFELAERRGGYFVEFGAGDGEHLSNTWLLENAYGWTGLLAEPDARFHATLRRRACTISHDCVFATSGATFAFNCAPDPHFSTLEAFSAQDMHAQHRQSGEIREVRTISLDDLLEQARAPREIDYLSIDTEGSELDILRAFDFSRRGFGLITVEHNRGPNREKIHDLLTSHGYRRKFEAFTDFDDWYVNDEICARLRRRGDRTSCEGSGAL